MADWQLGDHKVLYVPMTQVDDINLGGGMILRGMIQNENAVQFLYFAGSQVKCYNHGCLTTWYAWDLDVTQGCTYSEF